MTENREPGHLTHLLRGDLPSVARWMPFPEILSPEETAMAFCREVLGWHDAYPAKAAIRRLGDIKDPERESLPYENLDAVMERVTAWADRNRVPWVRLDYSMPDRNFYAKVCEGRSHPRACPCWALLSACVEANRVLESQRSTGSQGAKP